MIWQSARGAMRGPRARRRRTSRRRAMGEGGDELRELEVSEGAARQLKENEELNGLEGSRSESGRGTTAGVVQEE